MAAVGNESTPLLPPFSVIPSVGARTAVFARQLKSGDRGELCRAWEPASVSKSPSTFSFCDCLPSTNFPGSWTSLLILHPTSYLHARNDTSGREQASLAPDLAPFSRNPLGKDGNVTAIQSTQYGSKLTSWPLDSGQSMRCYESSLRVTPKLNSEKAGLWMPNSGVWGQCSLLISLNLGVDFRGLREGRG